MSRSHRPRRRSPSGDLWVRLRALHATRFSSTKRSEYLRRECRREEAARHVRIDTNCLNVATNYWESCQRHVLTSFRFADGLHFRLQPDTRNRVPNLAEYSTECWIVHSRGCHKHRMLRLRYECTYQSARCLSTPYLVFVSGNEVQDALANNARLSAFARSRCSRAVVSVQSDLEGD